MKKATIIIALSVILATAAWGQLILSAGGNGYLGQGQFMFGAGAAFEFAFEGCFSGGKTEATSFGLGFEWCYETTTYTKTPGNLFIMPLVIKERLLLANNFAIDFGIGGAMLMLDIDKLDYYDEYYVTTGLGGAVFGEAGIIYVFPSTQVLVLLNLRGGGSFIEDGTYPFFGIVLHLGYAFILPEPEYPYSDY